MFEHLTGEFVHAGGGGRTGGADHFVSHGIDRADVVNQFARQVHRQFFAFVQHIGHAFVGGIAAGVDFAVQEQHVAHFPCSHFFFGQLVHIDAAAVFRVVGDVRPVFDGRRGEHGGTAAVQFEFDVAGGGAVRNHGHGFGRGVGRIIQDFHVQHGGQAAQALRAYAQGVYFFKEFQAQGFDGGEFRARCGFFLQFVDVDVAHQGFFGQQGGFFGCAADADTQNARRTPARAHGRHGFQDPIDDAVGRVEHGHFGFVFRTAAFGRAGYFDFVARHDFHVDDGGGVVFGVLSFAGRIGQNRCAQFVVGIGVGTAHALVYHFLNAHLRVPLHVHADFQKDGGDACVLADGAVALGTHAAVYQNLRHRVFGGRILFFLPSLAQGFDVIDGMVVADELEGIGDALDKVFLFDYGHFAFL